GAGNDVLTADIGNNLVLGDSGFIVLAKALGDADYGVTLSVAVDPTLPKTGNVVVSALSLSGTVDLNGGQPVGGNKTAVYNHPYTSDNDPSDIDWIESIAWSVGGNDAIRTLGDNDIAIGGAGADLIKVGAGQSLVFGDA